MDRIQKILVLTDFSAHADEAFHPSSLRNMEYAHAG